MATSVPVPNPRVSIPQSTNRLQPSDAQMPRPQSSSRSQPSYAQLPQHLSRPQPSYGAPAPSTILNPGTSLQHPLEPSSPQVRSTHAVSLVNCSSQPVPRRLPLPTVLHHNVSHVCQSIASLFRPSLLHFPDVVILSCQSGLHPSLAMAPLPGPAATPHPLQPWRLPESCVDHSE